jgi:hypothetical protein
MVQRTVCRTKQLVLVCRGGAEGEQQVTTCNGKGKDNGKALALANFNLSIFLTRFGASDCCLDQADNRGPFLSVEYSNFTKVVISTIFRLLVIVHSRFSSGKKNKS